MWTERMFVICCIRIKGEILRESNWFKPSPTPVAFLLTVHLCLCVGICDISFAIV